MFRRCALALIVMGLQGLSSSPTWAQARDQSEEPSTTESKPDAAKSAPVDPSGTWKWQYRFGDNAMDAKLKLDWDGTKLTGKYTAREATSDIRDGKLERDQVSFVTRREINGNEFEVQFRGKVKEDAIDGTVEIEFGGQPQEFDWSAKRAVEIDDVVGVWDLRVETANGVVEPRLTITHEGKELRGKSLSQVFGELEAKNLTLKNNELSWEIVGENSGVEIHVKYKGKPRGNKIEGTNEFTLNGNTGGTMKFSGKRTPPKEKAGDQGKADEKSDSDAANAGKPTVSASAESSTSQ